MDNNNKNLYCDNVSLNYYDKRCNNRNICSTNMQINFPKNALELSRWNFCQKIQYNSSYQQYLSSKISLQYALKTKNLCQLNCAKRLYIGGLPKDMVRRIEMMKGDQVGIRAQLNKLDSRKIKKPYYKSFENYLKEKRAASELIPNREQSIFY